MKTRYEALKWWSRLNLEERFYITTESKRTITGDKARHPDTLTGREIETIYNEKNRTNLAGASHN